jgi:hypothetical protein
MALFHTSFSSPKSNHQKGEILPKEANSVHNFFSRQMQYVFMDASMESESKRRSEQRYLELRTLNADLNKCGDREHLIAAIRALLVTNKEILEYV